MQPTYRVKAKLVGTVMFSSEMVRDEADQYPTFMLFTPALTDITCWPRRILPDVRTDAGSREP